MKRTIKGAEIGALVFFGASVFFFVCLIFSAGSIFNPELEAPNRLTYHLAYPFLYLFGLVSSFILLILLCFWSGIIFFKTRVRSLFVKAVATVLTALFLAGFFSLLFQHPGGADNINPWSGTLGVSIGNFSESYFGTTIGALILFLMFFISFILATDWFFVHAIRGEDMANEFMESPITLQEEAALFDSQTILARAEPAVTEELEEKETYDEGEEEVEEEEEKEVKEAREVEEAEEDEEEEAEEEEEEEEQAVAAASDEEEEEEEREAAVADEEIEEEEEEERQEEIAAAADEVVEEGEDEEEKKEQGAAIVDAKKEREEQGTIVAEKEEDEDIEIEIKERKTSITEDIIEESKGFEKASLLKEIQSDLSNLFIDEGGKKITPPPSQNQKIGHTQVRFAGEGGKLSEEWSEREGESIFNSAVEVVLREKRGSVSLLQRRLNINYYQASQVIEEMEKRGIVGPYKGAKAREVLIDNEEWEKQKDLASTQEDGAVETI